MGINLAVKSLAATPYRHSIETSQQISTLEDESKSKSACVDGWAHLGINTAGCTVFRIFSSLARAAVAAYLKTFSFTQGLLEKTIEVVYQELPLWRLHMAIERCT